MRSGAETPPPPPVLIKEGRVLCWTHSTLGRICVGGQLDVREQSSWTWSVGTICQLELSHLLVRCDEREEVFRVSLDVHPARLAALGTHTDGASAQAGERTTVMQILSECADIERAMAHLTARGVLECNRVPAVLPGPSNAASDGARLPIAVLPHLCLDAGRQSAHPDATVAPIMVTLIAAPRSAHAGNGTHAADEPEPQAEVLLLAPGESSSSNRVCIKHIDAVEDTVRIAEQGAASGRESSTHLIRAALWHSPPPASPSHSSPPASPSRASPSRSVIEPTFVLRRVLRDHKLSGIRDRRVATSQ